MHDPQSEFSLPVASPSYFFLKQLNDGAILARSPFLPDFLSGPDHAEAALLQEDPPFRGLLSPQNQARLDAHWAQASALPPGQTLHLELRREGSSSGHNYFRYVIQPYTFDHHGRPLALLCILRHADAEHALLHELTELRSYLDLAPDPIFQSTMEGVLLWVNRAACQLLGYSKEEQVGRTVTYAGEETPVALAQRLATLRREGHSFHQSTLRAKDGTSVPLEFSAHVLQVGDQLTIFSTGRDARPRREAQARLVQLEKLESISDMVGGVAHDFNNLLAIVSAGLEQVQPAGTLKGPWKAMEGALDRASSLVRRLQAFALRRPVKPQPCDLKNLLKDCEPRLRATLGPHIILNIHLKRGLQNVLADAAQLTEVLLNLAANSRDAIIDTGRFSLRLERYDAAADPVPVAGLAPGAYAALTVEDDGPGISPDHAARIFDPFFTTKGPGKGAGLGLTAAYGVLRQHGGRLELLPSPTGTRFRLLLPLLPSGAAPSEVRDEPVAGRRILLVDDEPDLLALLAPALERRGYRVRTASHAAAALIAWEESGGFDLLVTDVRMPGMDGPDLARRLRQEAPGLPVIFISGWFPEHGDAAPLTGTTLLRKPFRLTDLVNAVERMEA